MLQQAKLLELIQTKKYFILLLLFSLSVYSCKTKKNTVKKEDNKVNVIPISELFSRSCSTCHDLPSPMAHDSTAWKVILKDMQKRAHLSNKDISDIYSYLMEEQKKGNR